MEPKVHPYQYGKKGWVNTRAIQGNVQPEKVDAEKGILYDVVLCQAMQPRGAAGWDWTLVWTSPTDDDAWGDCHEVVMRVITPDSFIQKLVELSKAFGPNGQQVRFGHPNDCNPALGAYAGRVKNIRLRGNQAIGDIYLSEASAASPGKGDLRSYILKLAAEDTEAMMMSIVFTPGKMYFTNADGQEEEWENTNAQARYMLSLPEEDRILYETVQSWHFTDFVDQGANTLDMFRDQKGNISIAARATDFLNNNPEIWDALVKSPEVMEEFINKYNAHRARKNSTFKTVNKNQKSTATLLESIQKGISNLLQSFRSADGMQEDDQPKKGIEATTDGGANITIDTDSDKPAVGDQVTLTGTSDAPPAGEHTLTGDLAGYVITTDDAGEITAVTEPESAPADPAAPAPVQEDAATAEGNERNIAALADVVKGMQSVVEGMAKTLQRNTELLTQLQENPLTRSAFANSANRITDPVSNEPETEWARLQREINERKAQQANLKK